MQVVIRASAGHTRGMGHVVRCATLAASLISRGAKVHFLTNNVGAQWLKNHMPEVQVHLIEDGLDELDDAAACQELLGDTAFDWCVVDQYELCAPWEEAMRKSAKHILAIDDIGRAHAADILSDSKPKATYDFDAARVQLLGPDYVLLRGAFAAMHEQIGTRDEQRLFICFGGSDPADMTGFTLTALAGKLPEDTSVDVVVGASYPQVQEAGAICAKYGWQLHIDHPAPEQLMARASLAVGAGGTMSWERCALALPAIVITIAENQRAQCRYLHEAGAMVLLGDSGHVDKEELVSQVLEHLSYHEAMGWVAHQQVDGKGAQRVAEAMETFGR